MKKLLKLQKNLVFILAFAFISIVMSCQNQFYNKIIKEELSLEKTPETVASEYFKKIESLDSFCCSSLIYKSWKRMSNDYDMSLPVLFWVAPSDIANSNKTVLVTSFNNK